MAPMSLPESVEGDDVDVGVAIKVTVEAAGPNNDVDEDVGKDVGEDTGLEAESDATAVVWVLPLEEVSPTSKEIPVNGAETVVKIAKKQREGCILAC
ncbi:hypothetical protein PFICI_13100 [Pestalotiopsis fici W106-1]|uniref:Uncharacterized protein n=1 Tax=Pestalotiopsis fici (strain W106-1 / CGMCC3.15140) TaxID=1229662 RepID=W3WP76_PESFW|nr:uncharacterized protein PFICI_13100 [Pestalotiopsis fici W106-1]ETS74616.1 hypothetical protein PFICI_13100 [Pestalotiopsis fici W106-1]